MASQARKKREKERRRREIMAAARTVFAAKGFQGATMEEIAEKADYSPATLYLYFKNKHELYTSLIISLLQFIEDKFQGLRARQDLTPLEKLRQLPQVMYEVYEFDPAVLMNLFHLQASRGGQYMSPELIEQLNSLAGSAIRGLAGIFAEGMAQGVFQDHHPMALADSVWALFTGMVLWEESKRFFNQEKAYLKQTWETAMKLMADGIIAKKG